MYEDLFYKRLAELRANKGVSARDMSLSIGQSAGYINALENRNGFPSMQVFFYICEYLGVTPAEFFEDWKPVSRRVSGDSVRFEASRSGQPSECEGYC